MNWRNQGYFTTWQSEAWETGRPDTPYINDDSFSRRIIEKSDGLTRVGLQKLSETVKDYVYLILTSQTSMIGPMIGNTAQNFDDQKIFLNTFENIIDRRADIPEDIQRFQNTLQYARSKVDYANGEYIYLLPSDMNLRIGKIKRYNNKILISSPSFKIGSNLKINLDDDKTDVKSKKDDKHVERDKPDVKSKMEEIIADIKSKKDIKPHMNDKITHEEEEAALILGITSVFTVWWIFK